MNNFKFWFNESLEPKTLIIMRGISGSGKSTLAKRVVGEKGVIFSTDDFFMNNGKYEFDPKMISRNHALNQKRTEDAMKEEITPIVVDNTNLQGWEARPYVELADKYNYSIKILETPSLNIEELLKRQNLRKKTGKNLSREVLERMIKKYEKGLTLDDIRKAKNPYG